MTRRDIAKLERQVKRAREDRKRLADFAEGVPSFAPQSDGSGVEKNARLRKLNELNQHAPRQGERRRAGFPSTFGPLAREQEEAANEARARLLRPTNDRLAREAMKPITPPPDGLPGWLSLAAMGVAVIATVVLLWAVVQWWLMVRGRQ